MNAHEMNNKMSNTVNKTSKWWTQTEQRAWKHNSCKTANKTQKNAPKTRKWHRQESANHQKLTNMSNLARKTMNQSVKLLQKAKEARMYMPHAKTQEVQQNNHTIIRVDTYKYRLKMPKHNNVKNWLFWFGNFRTIRNSKNSEENPTWTKHSYKTIAHAQSCNTQAKVHQHPMKCTRKPGQRRQQPFWQITSS